MENNLKNCPFCGSKAELVSKGVLWGVRCTNEGCLVNNLSPNSLLKGLIIDEWNQRVIDEEACD